MLDGRAEKMQAQSKPKVGGGRGESREDDGKPCWFSSFRGGRQKRGRRQEGGSGGGQGRGSEGLREEGRSGARLTLRPCRMHKPGTRDKKSSQKHDTSKEAHERKKRKKKNH